MTLNKIAIIIVVALTPIIGLQSCYKVATVIPSNTVEITEPVSFSSEIIPLFDSKCNMSGCHNSGGVKPDLTAEKAFKALENGGYIDLNTPENSSLYLWLTGKKGSPMPPGGPENPSNINQYVLAWIKQGAQNN